MRYGYCLVLLLLCCNYTAIGKRRGPQKQKTAAPQATVQQRPEPKPDPFAGTDRITCFDSWIILSADGALDITENITIYNGFGEFASAGPEYLNEGGANNEIKKGIIRTFPTKYVSSRRLFQNTTFELKEVLLDGKPVNWDLKGAFGTNGYTLRIGDPSRELEKGFFTYTIRYRTQHQVKFLDHYDELTWNVTGNGWGFRIDSALCHIIIPGNDSIFSSACYTGAQGENTGNCLFRNRTDTVIFSTRKTLLPYEGLTVATSWRKGVIAAPSFMSRAWWMLKNNIGALGMPLLWIIILLYNIVKWWRHGRDLRAGTIVVQYEAPAGFSPAALGYIYFQKMQNRLLAATITDLALRNLFRIDVERAGLIFKENEYHIRSSELEYIPVDYEDFSSDAKGLNGTSIRKGHYNKGLDNLRKDIARELEARYEGRPRKNKKPLFILNTKYLLFGYLLSIFPFIALLFLVLFDVSVNPWPLVPLIGGFILCMITQAVFSRLMSNYTVEGRKLKDQIEGYRRYLKTVDENRLNLMNPPEKTIDLFEKNLAFAIALDCEVEWGKKFEGIIGTAIQEGTAHSGLYHSSAFGSSSGFSGSAFVSGFSGAISSASTPPSSSSGGGSSFGGGSSGSGGGGGGGGGW